MLVEAGGVEPPSEKVRNEENYVRFQFKVFDRRFRTGKSGDGLVRLSFGHSATNRSL